MTSSRASSWQRPEPVVTRRRSSMLLRPPSPSLPATTHRRTAPMSVCNIYGVPPRPGATNTVVPRHENPSPLPATTYRRTARMRVCGIQGVPPIPFATHTVVPRHDDLSPAPMDQSSGDDVVFLRSTTQGASRRRNQPAVGNHDLEEGEDLKPSSNKRARTAARASNPVDCDKDDNSDPETKTKATLELKFRCLVCLDALEKPASTTCGHLFCENCIKRSIQSQKKCPGCRKKLTLRSFHRIYFPAVIAENGC